MAGGARDSSDWEWKVWRLTVGIALFGAGVYLAIRAEHHVLTHRDAIAVLRGELLEMPDCKRIDPAMDGKIVHAVGMAETKEDVADPDMGFAIRTVMLKREVEYYQWVRRSKHPDRQHVLWAYSRKWIRLPGKPGDGPRGERKNFILVGFPDERWFAPTSFGAYRMPDYLKLKLSSLPLALPPMDPIAVMERWKNLVKEARQNGWYPVLSNQLNAKMIHVLPDKIYVGRNPKYPEIGDVRIGYVHAPPGQISLIARVAGDSFEPFETDDGLALSYIAAGTVGAEEMLNAATAGDT